MKIINTKIILSSIHYSEKSGNYSLLKKNGFENSAIKQDKIEKILGIIRVASEKNKPFDESGLVKTHIYRFSPKYQGERLHFVLHCYSNQVGIIRVGDSDPIYLGKSEFKKIKDILDGDPWNSSLDEMLNGNRFEKISIGHENAKQDSFWNNWKNDCNLASMDYEKIIYPLFLSYIQKLVQAPARILELCGGDGMLAKKICHNQPDLIVHYYLLDLNRLELDRACKTFIEYFGANSQEGSVAPETTLSEKENPHDDKPINFTIRGEVQTVSIFQQNIISANYQELIDEPVDLIIACGALTEHVLPSKEDALKALSAASQRLKEGGYVLISGHANSLICSEDLKQLGFEIVNTNIPFARTTSYHSTFYVARKLPQIGRSEHMSPTRK